LLFFFSSRRRHTRFSRDWSSDVCSSDLGGFVFSCGYLLCAKLFLQTSTRGTIFSTFGNRTTCFVLYKNLSGKKQNPLQEFKPVTKTNHANGHTVFTTV